MSNPRIQKSGVGIDNEVDLWGGGYVESQPDPALCVPDPQLADL